MAWALLLLAVFLDGTVPDTLPIWFLFVGAVPLWVCYGGGPLLTAARRGNGPVQDLGLTARPRDFASGVAAGLVTQFLILWALYFPILWFIDDDPSQPARELINSIDGNLDRFLLIVLVTVAAPVVEEVFFRGLLLRALMRRFGPLVAVCVQAAVFAAVHAQWLQFPGLFVFGLVAGGLVAVTGRLGPAVIAHMAFNAGTLALLL